MTVIVPQQTRGPGLVGPTTWRNIVGQVVPNSDYKITPLMDLADIQDPALAITLKIEFSDDGITPWGGWFEVGFNCGIRNKQGVLQTLAPSYTWSSSATPPNFYRVSATLSRVVNNIGLDVAIT